MSVPTLEIDSDYKEVRCPRCDHIWWAAVMKDWFSRGTRCPECKTPLRAPHNDGYLPFLPKDSTNE